MTDNIAGKYKLLETFFTFFKIPNEQDDNPDVINITCLKCLPNTLINITTANVSLLNLGKHIVTLHPKDFITFKDILLRNKVAAKRILDENIQKTNVNSRHNWSTKDLLECENCSFCFESESAFIINKAVI